MLKKLFYRFFDWLYEKANTEYVTPEMIFQQPFAIWHDGYGNRIFYAVLCALEKRGYYNNMAEKKAAMEGTYRNYGWQYSVEQYALGQHLDPRKYKDRIPKNPRGKPWPMHIMVIAKDKTSDQKVQRKR